MECPSTEALAGADFHINCEDDTQYITAEEVKNITALAEVGMQKLRELSNKRITSFYFAIPLRNGHMAAMVIRTIPTSNPPSQNPSFQVLAYYVICHEIELFPNELQWLYRQLQVVYNTYIVAVRWTFTEDCCEGSFLAPEANTSCHQSAQRGFDKLTSEQKADTSSITLHQERESEPDGKRSEAVRTRNRGDLTAPSPPNVNRIAKRRRADTTVHPSPPVVPIQKSTRPVEAIAASLVSKAKSGMQKFMSLEKHTFSPTKNAILQLESKCVELRGNREKLHETLLQLETKFLVKAKNKTVEMQLAVWTDWLYSACLRLILFLQGASTQHRRASASFILCSIVNNLVLTEGVSALVIFPAFGVWRHTLSDASLKGRDDQLRISRLVADGLRGALVTLPDDCELLIPAAWISRVAQITIRDAYTSLGMPNLAVLGLSPECYPIHVEKDIAMAHIRRAWSGFEQEVSSKLAILRQAHKLARTGDLEGLSQFAQSCIVHDSPRFPEFLRHPVVATNAGHLEPESTDVFTVIAEEFTRTVHSWLNQKEQSQGNMTISHAGDIEHGPELAGSSTLYDNNVIAPATSATTHEPVCDSVGMLLDAAHQVNTLTVENSFAMCPSNQSGMQRPGDDFETDPIWRDIFCIDTIVNFDDVVAPVSSHGGGLLPEDTDSY
ncbi:hypothetical protein GGR57DRAFT_515838 [Xylariaceae sp. FL1272]|nr:hypothetical protein GGR57DRAFT_515838 [Xylariaceae sp. FL1272]